MQKLYGLQWNFKISFALSYKYFLKCCENSNSNIIRNVMVTIFRPNASILVKLSVTIHIFWVKCFVDVAHVFCVCWERGFISVTFYNTGFTFSQKMRWKYWLKWFSTKESAWLKKTSKRLGPLNKENPSTPSAQKIWAAICL